MDQSATITLLIVGIPVAIVGAILILVSARHDPDVANRRTPARYIGVVCFLSVFVALFAAYAVVSSLAEFVVDQEEIEFGGDEFGGGFDDEFGGGFGDEFDDFGSFTTTSRPSDDALWRGAVQAGLLAVVAGVIFVGHRRLRDAHRSAAATDAASTRVDRTYIYVTCFLAVLVVLAAAAFGAYGVFQAIAPGIASDAGGSVARQQGIAQAISLVFLACGAAVIFAWHWRGRGEPAAVEAPSAAPAPTA